MDIQASLDWIDAQPIKVPEHLTSAEYDLVTGLIGSQAFGLLMSLVLYEKMETFAHMANLSVAQPEQARLISVLQGKIQGLDGVAQLVLNLKPKDPTEQEMN